MKNYLPSKKFIRLLIGFAILGLIFVAGYFLFSGKISFISSGTNKGLVAEKTSLNELLKKDTDGDGLFDWEEALWGTNPKNPATFEGVPDKTYVDEKRKELGVGEENGNELTPENETAKFAQEFFASIVAMQQAGSVDPETIKNVSDALGKEISNPLILDSYVEKNIKEEKVDSADTQIAYSIKAADLFEKAQSQGAGQELEIIGSIASAKTADQKSVTQLGKIANAYQEFAKQLMEIAVPKSLKKYHIDIVNSANNTGISVLNMMKIVDDPIIGLSGVSQYQKYSNDLVSTVGNLETFLIINGIISE